VRLICFLATLACFMLLCMSVFAYNLPMTMLAGAGCLVFTYLGAGAQRSGSSTSNSYRYDDNRQEHHNHHYHGGYGRDAGISMPRPPRPNAPARVHRRYRRELAAAQAQQQLSHMPESLPDIELALKRRYIVREEAEVEFVPASLPPQLQALLAQQQAAAHTSSAPQIVSRPLTVVASEPSRPAVSDQRSGWQNVAKIALLGPPRKV
jgi:hypothetical protein